MKYLGIQTSILFDIHKSIYYLNFSSNSNLPSLVLRTFSPSLFFQRLSTARFTYAQVQYIIAQPNSALHSAQKYSMVVSIGFLLNKCIRLVLYESIIKLQVKAAKQKMQVSIRIFLQRWLFKTLWELKFQLKANLKIGQITATMLCVFVIDYTTVFFLMKM